MADENPNEASNGDAGPEPEEPTPSIVNAEETLKSADPPAVVEPTEPLEIQIVSLDNTEPVISYKGDIYTCQWASSIGSDLLFAKRDIQTSPDHEVLHSFESWDLVAIGSAKLVASHASLHPRRFEGTEDHIIPLTPAPATLGPGLSVPDLEEEERLRQSDFLKRFADIKAKKGEATEHTLTMLQGKTNAEGKEIAQYRGRGGGKGSRGPRRARQPRIASSVPRLSGIDTARQNALQHLAPVPQDSTPPNWSHIETSPYAEGSPYTPPYFTAPYAGHSRVGDSPYAPPLQPPLPAFPNSGDSYPSIFEGSGFPTFPDSTGSGSPPT
jgi:hypothetical protein